MEVIYRAYRSVWTVLNYEKRLTDSDEAHEPSDKVTRKLVEVAREGLIDLETLRERTLAGDFATGPQIRCAALPGGDLAACDRGSP